VGSMYGTGCSVDEDQVTNQTGIKISHCPEIADAVATTLRQCFLSIAPFFHKKTLAKGVVQFSTTTGK